MTLSLKDFDFIKDILLENKTGRISIKRGCSAIGGCFCTGICEDIIGYYEAGKFISVEPRPREKQVGISSYPWNEGRFPPALGVQSGGFIENWHNKPNITAPTTSE